MPDGGVPDLAFTGSRGHTSPMSLRERLSGKWAKRLLALGIGFLLVEVAVVPLIVMSSSLRMRGWLPAPLAIMGQSSKDGLIPRDYVLILGDSNAEGHGDWLTESLAAGERNPAFHSAHVIHAETGRDVITFGRGGAGNVAATAYVVEKRFAALWRAGLGEPRDVLVFFYEGNDPTDNINEARRRFGLGERTPESYRDDEWRNFVAARAKRGWQRGVPGALFTPYLILNALKGGTAGGRSGAGVPQVLPFVPDFDGTPPDENFVALELTDAELTFSLDALEHSVAWAHDRFADSRLTIVYIPAPMSCYEIVSPRVQIQRYNRERDEHYPVADVRRRSDENRARVSAIATELEAGFLDLTPGLRAAAAMELIHGPVDGKHFNRAGYTRMGEIIARDALGLPR